MTSSSSAQKDKKITFCLVSRKVSRKVQPAVVAGTALQKLAFVVVVAAVVAVATLARHHCVFFVQAPTEPSLAQSLLPSPVFLFRSFPAGRPRSHFQQSVFFWVVCSPQNFLFHPLSFSLWSSDSPWPPSLPLLPFPSLPCHLSYSCCFCGFRQKHPLSQ